MHSAQTNNDRGFARKWRRHEARSCCGSCDRRTRPPRVDIRGQAHGAKASPCFVGLAPRSGDRPWTWLPGRFQAYFDFTPARRLLGLVLSPGGCGCGYRCAWGMLGKPVSERVASALTKMQQKISHRSQLFTPNACSHRAMSVVRCFVVPARSEWPSGSRRHRPSTVPHQISHQLSSSHRVLGLALAPSGPSFLRPFSMVDPAFPSRPCRWLRPRSPSNSWRLCRP